jgi:flagellar protein FlgJ
MNPLDKLSPAPATAPGADTIAPATDPVLLAKATKAAVDFESFFISHMLQQMRSSTREMAGEDSVFNDRINRDMQDMTDKLLADKMAGQRAFGVADAILRQILPAPLNKPK